MVDFAEHALGMPCFPWQRWLLIHMLELDAFGLLRFRKVVVLVARQNGKSLLAEILALYFMYALKAKLVLGTAQDLATAEDVWQDTLDIATESDLLAPLLTRPVLGKGYKEFSIRDDEVERKVRGTYKVKTANRRGGRGARGAKLVLLDEIREHQTWDAWGAITKTTNAVAEALVLALSNAGDVSSVVLRYLRLMAHRRLGDPDGVVADSDPTALVDEESPDHDDMLVDEGDDSLALFEWSAPPGVSVRDRSGWAQANPSLGYGTITERTLASDAATDPEWVFRTEVLCQWSDGALDGPFPPGTWDAGKVDQAQADAHPIEGVPVACLEVSHDRTKAAIVYAGYRADGLPMVEVPHYRYDTGAAVEWLTSDERTVRPSAVAIRKTGPAASLAPDLEAAGYEVVWWEGGEISQACGDLFDAVVGNPDPDAAPGAEVRCGDLRHAAHTVLDVAAATAVTKPFGDRWSWDMAKSPTDISPLFALTGALWLLARPTEPERDSAYVDHDLIII